MTLLRASLAMTLACACLPLLSAVEKPSKTDGKADKGDKKAGSAEGFFLRPGDTVLCLGDSNTENTKWSPGSPSTAGYLPPYRLTSP